MRHNPGNGHLRKCGRTYFRHFLMQNRIYEAVENRILVRIIHFHPPAARTRPGGFFGNALHGNGRHITDNVTDRNRRFAVINDIDVRFIRNNEQIIFPGDPDNILQILVCIDKTGRIVGIDNQDSNNRPVASDFLFQLPQVRMPVIIGIHPVGIGWKRRMKNFRHEMRGIRRLRHNHARIYLNGAISPGNRITQTVEENDVFRRYLNFPPCIYAISQKRARGIHPFGRRIGIRDIFLEHIDQDFFHPIGNIFTLLNRIANVFPDDFLAAKFLHFLGNGYKIADFISQPAAAAGNFKTHKLSNSLNIWIVIHNTYFWINPEFFKK